MPTPSPTPRVQTTDGDLHLKCYDGRSDVPVPAVRRNVSGDALLLAPLTLYLSCTRAWPITARYMDRGAYQPRWDRFISEPSSWWEEHVDELTERFGEPVSPRTVTLPPGSLPCGIGKSVCSVRAVSSRIG